jgi:hypothetical protein
MERRKIIYEAPSIDEQSAAKFPLDELANYLGKYPSRSKAIYQSLSQ